MKKLSLVLFLCTLSTYLFAQSPSTIKGIVSDSTANIKLRNATISILNAKDSTLYKFTRATENGAFEIQPMRTGNFILLLTYPEYADYVYHFKLDEGNPSFNFKTLNMKLKATLLNEVIIKGQAAAIKIKGDTTEYNAGSYAIQPNDKVEDLLKKFPGMQVDKDGKVTAQGKVVSKILVDGEEFFGDDPTLVTKNLRADMVDKVQLYEKSSDQAAFTGVDDGQKTTTLNIKLKENMKKGYFGKVDVGYGTKGFYEGSGLFNLFKAKQKFSVYGTSGNNGKTGLSWEDNNRLGVGDDNMEMFDGGMMSYGGGDDLDGGGGSYYGEGIPLAHTGGVHYDTKWNLDKESLNTNYKLGSLSIKTNKNTISQNNLPTGIFNTNTEDNSDRYVFRQKLDATYSIKLDTTSNLKVMVSGTLKNNTANSDRLSVGTRGDHSLLTGSNNQSNTKGDEQVFNISAFYNKKLKKVGRNFSISLSQVINQKNSTGNLYAKNDFYNTSGVLDSTNVVDQYKANIFNTSTFNGNITYNEPITKATTMVLNYGLTVNDSEADRKSFNASTPGNYNTLDTKYSNDFSATQLVNQAGAVFNYKKPKTTIAIGTKVNFVDFNQTEAYTKQTYNRSFINWLPQATYQYKFSAQKYFRFNYNGSTQQPSVNQLQPVRVNDDPLNQYLGNPDLKPSLSNRFNVNYQTYKVLTSQSIYLNGSFSFTNNQVVNNTVTDLAGKTVSQSVNLTEKVPINYYVYGSFRRKIKFLGINGGFGLNYNDNTSYNYVNNVLNETNSFNFTPTIDFNKYKENVFDFYTSFGPSYTSQVSSLQKTVANKGWGYMAYGGGGYKFLKKYSLNADVNYTYNPASAAFSTSFEQLIVNTSLSRSFFKKEELKLKFKVNDLLNQNQGFSRNAYGNYITQTSYNNISRYFMFSLVWDFSKMGGASTTSNK